MCALRKTKEVPVQNFAKIKLLYLPNALSGGQLFTDLSFPPDQSSLTYVYTGDDKYEKMVFKRPLVSCSFMHCFIVNLYQMVRWGSLLLHMYAENDISQYSLVYGLDFLSQKYTHR